MDALDTPVASPSPTPAPPPIYRAVVLARRADRLVIAGGGVLRISPACACAPVQPGTAFALELDPDGVIVAIRPLGGARIQPPSAIPRAAFAYPVISSTGGDPSKLVTITILVSVPPQTPTTDTVYVSTERSNWKVDELRMNRVDALHWSLTFSLPLGAHVAYRYTRGAYSTIERDEARQLPPPHNLTAKDGLKITDAIANWADIN